MIGPEALRAFDTIVKAPLWLFFASAIFFGSLTFTPTAVLERINIKAPVTIFHFGPAIYFILSLSLFISSLAAHLTPGARNSVRQYFRLKALSRKIHDLTIEERAVLALFEQDHRYELYMNPSAPVTTALRNAGLIAPTNITPYGQWGGFRLNDELSLMRQYRPDRFRKLTAVSDQVLYDMRIAMLAAEQSAKPNLRV